jgi:tetratricopeptide (TPR) repeat protein
MTDLSELLDSRMDERIMHAINDLDFDGFKSLISELLGGIGVKVTRMDVSEDAVFFEGVSDEGKYFVVASRLFDNASVESMKVLKEMAAKRDATPVLVVTCDLDTEERKYAEAQGISYADRPKLLMLLRKYDLAGKMMAELDRRILEQERNRYLPSGVQFDAFYNAAEEHFKQRRYRDALYNYDRALDIKPNNDIVWLRKANVFLAMGRFDDALVACKRASELRPGDSTTWYLMGLAYNQLGDFEKELKAYDTALKISPRMEAALLNKGATLFQLHRYDWALKVYDDMCNFFPKDAMAFNNRGIVLKAMGRHKEALESFDRASFLNRSYIDPNVNRALTLIEMGRVAEAIESWKEALQIDRDRADIWYSLGASQKALGQFEDATRSFENAVMLDKGMTEAVTERDELLAAARMAKMPQEPEPAEVHELSPQEVIETMREQAPQTSEPSPALELNPMEAEPAPPEVEQPLEVEASQLEPVAAEVERSEVIEPEFKVEEPVPEPEPEELVPEPEPMAEVRVPVSEPEPVMVEIPEPIPEPEFKVEEPVAEVPEVIPEPEVKVEELIAEPDLKVEEPVPELLPEPEIKVEEPIPESVPEPESMLEQPVPEPVAEVLEPFPEPEFKVEEPVPEPEPVNVEVSEPVPEPETVAEAPEPISEPEPAAEISEHDVSSIIENVASAPVEEATPVEEVATSVTGQEETNLVPKEPCAVVPIDSEVEMVVREQICSDIQKIEGNTHVVPLEPVCKPALVDTECHLAVPEERGLPATVNKQVSVAAPPAEAPSPMTMPEVQPQIVSPAETVMAEPTPIIMVPPKAEAVPIIPEPIIEPPSEPDIPISDRELKAAVILNVLGENARALEEIDLYIREKSESHDARHIKAIILDDLGRLPECLEELKEAIRLDPKDEIALMDIESISKRLGRKDELMVILSSITPSKEVRAREAANLLNAKRYDDILTKFSTPSPLDSIVTKMALSTSLMVKARYRDAYRVLKEILLEHPTYPEALNNMGVCMRFMGEYAYDEPMHFMRLAVEADPNYGDAWNNIGATLFVLGEYDAAMEAIRKAITVDRRSDYLLNLSKCQIMVGDIAGAKLSLTSALKYEETAEIDFALGLIAEKEGDMKWALKLYDSAIELVPNFKDAIFNRQRVKLFLKYTQK